jgi:lysine 2,3-aminomutase
LPKPRYIASVRNIPQLNREEKRDLERVQKQFSFRSNEYYQSLIDWGDPNDPIRRIIMPDLAELEEWGDLDASDESSYTKVPGLEHKYESVALLLVNDVCGGYCRFCFRKRLFMEQNDEVVKDISEGLEYIRRHPEITNVLLSGGDPLIMSTAKLKKIIRSLRDIDHVHIIRLGTKMPAFNPFRIIDDPSLLEMLERYSTPDKRIYVMVHFNHPKELTPDAVEGLGLLQNAGVITANQTPLIRGVNDDPDTLASLFRKCSFVGVPPYYVFQCRPTLGNKAYAVPIEEAYQIFEAAKSNCSGLAFRARYVMSHHTGKIEVLGLINKHIIFKYHRSAEQEDTGRLMVFKRNPFAYWFDDYEEAVAYHTFAFPSA